MAKKLQNSSAKKSLFGPKAIFRNWDFGLGKYDISQKQIQFFFGENLYFEKLKILLIFFR